MLHRKKELSWEELLRELEEKILSERARKIWERIKDL